MDIQARPDTIVIMTLHVLSHFFIFTRTLLAFYSAMLGIYVYFGLLGLESIVAFIYHTTP